MIIFTYFKVIKSNIKGSHSELDFLILKIINTNEEAIVSTEKISHNAENNCKNNAFPHKIKESLV